MSGKSLTITKYISAGALGGAITGDAIDMADLNEISFTLTTSSASTLNTDVTLQVSNDNSVWVATSTTSNLTADGSELFELAIKARYVRLVNANTGGTGVLNVSCHAKQS